MKLLPFDPEKALAGATVVTQSGEAVQDLCYFCESRDFPFRGSIAGHGMTWWTRAGHRALMVDGNDPQDLALVAEPRVRWVNFYDLAADHFATQIEADNSVRISTIIGGRGRPFSRLYGRAIRVEIDTEVSE